MNNKYITNLIVFLHDELHFTFVDIAKISKMTRERVSYLYHKDKAND